MRSLTILLFLFITSYLSAQEGSIKGVILDGEFNNEPLAFAIVNVKGTSVKGSTNLRGEFSLDINPGKYSLVFEFAGYESKELTNVTVGKENLRINDVILSARRVEMKIASIE